MSRKPISKKELNPDFTKKISQQSYSKKLKIEGVQVLDLPLFTSEDGYFLEIARLKKDATLQDLPDIKLRQLSYSVVNPGGIKAWHIHYKQEDVWFIPPESKATVGLYDLRTGSSTKGVSNKLILGSHKAQLLLIPRGVAHGIANNSQQPIAMFYLLNQQFDMQNPDEYRLPWDLLGSNFWEPVKG